MKAIYFLLKTSVDIILSVFILRAILSNRRSNFSNPITQIITRFTNPLVMPLRKVLPSLGKIDTSSIVSCLLIALAGSALLLGFSEQSFAFISSDPTKFFLYSLKKLVLLMLQLYWLLILFSIILSWAQPRQHSPLTSLLHELTEPLLAPARRLIKPLGGLDLSPIPVLILLSALQYQLS